MSSGEVRHFRSEAARNAFEHVAQAIKHGFVPTQKSGEPPKAKPRA